MNETNVHNMDEAQQQNQQPPRQPPAPPTPPEEPVAVTKPNTLGPVVGAVIVIIAILLGGYYIWDTQIRNREINQTTETPVDETLSALETQSDSDALSTIESDINDTELEAIDQELADIEASL